MLPFLATGSVLATSSESSKNMFHFLTRSKIFSKGMVRLGHPWLGQMLCQGHSRTCYCWFGGIDTLTWAKEPFWSKLARPTCGP